MRTVRRARGGLGGCGMPVAGAALVPVLGMTVAVGIPVTADPVLAAPSPNGPDFDGNGEADLAIGADGAVVVRYGGTGEVEILRAADGTAATGFGRAVATADFDADGRADLAVGAPAEASAAGAAGAGRVWVYHGTADGLVDADGTPLRVVGLAQGQDGAPGAAERGDAFGSALSTGDLTGDGVADLVVGSPGEAIGTAAGAGTVVAVPGRDGAGLDPGTAVAVHQDTDGVVGVAEATDRFGASVAVGDVTGDGVDDLAVGVPGENHVGMAHLFPGTKGGPAAAGSTDASGNAVGVVASSWAQLDPDRSGTDASYGAVVTVADVTGDGTADLVVGAPDARAGGKDFCGTITVLPGSPAGITPDTAQVTSQSSTDVYGACEVGDRWGSALAVGDMTGDGRPEVVVGAPGEQVGEAAGAGAYTVLATTAAGVSGSPSFGVTQDSAGAVDLVEPGDAFAHAIALYDADADGSYDAVVSAPFEEVGGTPLDPVAEPVADPGDEADPPGVVHLLLSTTRGRPARTSGLISGLDCADTHGTVTRLGLSLPS